MAKVDVPALSASLELDTTGFQQGATRAQRILGGIKGRILNTSEELDRLGNVAIGVGGGLAIGLTPGVVQAQRLEQALARTFSVGEITTTEMIRLRGAVLDLGKGVVGPVELAEGLYTLASAGLDVNQQMEVLPEASRLAIASQVDLGTSTQILVQVMRAYNLEASEAARISNVVSASNANSASNALRLADAFRYAAPSAAGLGLSLEETTAGLNILIDVLQRGEQAGTSFRSLLSQLADPLPELRAAVKEAGLSVRDIQPQFTDMADVVANLKTVLDDGNEATVLFGQETSTAADTLAAGSERFVEMQEAITGTNATTDQYNKQMGTTLNRLKSLRNTISVTAITFGQALKPVIDLTIESLKLFVEIVNAIPQPVKAAIALIAAFGSGYLLLGGIIAKVTAWIMRSTVTTQALAFAQRNLHQAAGKVGQVLRDMAMYTRAQVVSTRAATKAQNAFAAAKLRASTLYAQGANMEAVAEARAAAAKIGWRLKTARATARAQATTAAAYARTHGRTMMLAAATMGLRNAVMTLNASMLRTVAVLRVLLLNKVTITLVAIGLVLREMAKHTDVLSIAMGGLRDTFQGLGEIVAPLAPLFTGLGKLFSTVALGGVAVLADMINELSGGLARVGRYAQYAFEMLHPKNIFRTGEVMREMREDMEAIGDETQERSDEVYDATYARMLDIWGATRDEMAELRDDLDLTQEDFEESLGAVGDFAETLQESISDVVLSVDQTQLEGQLESIDDRFDKMIQDLADKAQENPIIMRITSEGELAGEGDTSWFEDMMADIEEGRERASEIVVDNFIADLQRQADEEWVESLDEGSRKIREEYLLRNRQLEEERKEALRGLEGDMGAIGQVERVFMERRLRSRQQYLDDLEAQDEQIADTIRQAEDEITNARIEAMEDGEAKIRAQYALRIRNAREATDERIEAVGDDTEAVTRLRELEREYLQVLYDEMAADLEDHQSTVEDSIEDSLRTYQEATSQLQEEIDKLQARTSEDPFASLLVDQRTEMRDAREEVVELLQQVQEDLDDDLISTEEALDRRAEIWELWGEKEIALLEKQGDDFREALREREADIIAHDEKIRQITAEARSLRVGAVGLDEARQERSEELRQLRAWYEEQTTLHEGNREELTRLEEEYHARHERIWAQFGATRRDLIEQSAEDYEEYADSLRELIANLRGEALQETDPLQAIVERHAEELSEHRGAFTDTLDQIRQDEEQSLISAEEAARRRQEIISAFTEAERELYGRQARAREELDDEIRRQEAEDIAAREQHAAELLRIRSETADIGSEDQAAIDRRARRVELAELEAWHAAQIAASDGTAESLLEIEEQYQARREKIIATAQEREQERHEAALQERIDTELELLAAVSEGAPGVGPDADELRESVEGLREFRAELDEAGASAEQLEEIDEAIGDTNDQIGDLARSARDELVDTRTDLETVIAELQEELYMSDAEASRSALDRKLANQEQELEALQQNLRRQLGETEEYHEAVATLDELQAQRRELLLERLDQAEQEREQERREAVQDAQYDIEQAIAQARGEAIRDEVRREDTLYRIERRERRRAFQEQLDDLDATLEERLELQRGFQERERLRAIEHEKRLTAIQREETIDRFADFVKLEQDVEKRREDERQQAARSNIAATEQQIAAREREQETQETALENVEREIAALEERNRVLAESMTGVTAQRNYYELVRDLFQSDGAARRGTRQRVDALEEERDVLAELYKDAVRANMPFETRNQLLQDLAQAEEEVVEAGGEELASADWLVSRARRDYRDAIDDAQRAAAEYERNQQTLEGLNREMESLNGTIDNLSSAIDRLNSALDRMNEEAATEVWSDVEQRFLSAAEAADLARDEYVNSLAGMIREVGEIADPEQMSESILRMFEGGQITTAVRRLAFALGGEIPRGVLEGILANPIPGDPSRSLAEQLGIDDPEAWIDDFAESYRGAVAEGTRDTPEEGKRNVEQTFEELFESPQQAIEEVVGSMGADAGEGFMSAFAEGIRSNGQMLISAVEDVLADLRDYLPSSDAKRGPLSDLTWSGRRFTQTWLAGAKSEEKNLTRGISGLLGSLTGPMPGGSRVYPEGMGAGGAGGPVNVTVSGRQQEAPGPLALNTRQFVRSVQREMLAQGVVRGGA